jgi:hypothetical protein
MHLASQKGHLEVVQPLLESGVDIDAKDKVSAVRDFYLGCGGCN